MRKLFVCVFLLLIVVFEFGFANAQTDLSDLVAAKKDVEQQRATIKDQIKTGSDHEQVKLFRKDTKLSNYAAAYQKAIDLIQAPEKSKFGESIVQNYASFSFSVAKLQPGEKVPREYVPIYKGAGQKYNVDWQVLAAIHSIETRFSSIKMVSPVGAIGHMQFMPATFAAYGVDANGDGQTSPWDLTDAIYSAARYLSANNYKSNLRKAIWHYNHADWYVNDVLGRAQSIKESSG
ncbi:lytic transglycosylase domain-containing protein [Sporolactobacillus terrae]|uniref:lytic transglycosylase domain-containing protein n=1 Tax=Sporolactobacillus terrae TaxID=269673 RepID=UPI00068408BE|nr:lytic murein transglycosylase [Sporolactobacillus terrae]